MLHLGVSYFTPTYAVLSYYLYIYIYNLANQHTLNSVCSYGNPYQYYMLCEYMKRNEKEKEAYWYIVS